MKSPEKVVPLMFDATPSLLHGQSDSAVAVRLVTARSSGSDAPKPAPGAGCLRNGKKAKLTQVRCQERNRRRVRAQSTRRPFPSIHRPIFAIEFIPRRLGSKPLRALEWSDSLFKGHPIHRLLRRGGVDFSAHPARS